MSKFENAPINKQIKKVATQNNREANILEIITIHTNNLIDYPNNNEDILDTLDLETSIKELGFIDPIEVTDFKMKKGQYTILSGHRRRVAGLKQNINEFPCIVKYFSSDSEMQNYILMANSSRDTAKDPLLYINRYKLHDDYLDKIDFKGNKNKEISIRLGISDVTGRRYRALNNVIVPILDLVKNEKIGMSSVVPIAGFDLKEQKEIYDLLKEHIDKFGSINRDNTVKLINNYNIGIFDVTLPDKYIIENKDAGPEEQGMLINFQTEKADTETVHGEQKNNKENAGTETIHGEQKNNKENSDVETVHGEESSILEKINKINNEYLLVKKKDIDKKDFAKYSIIDLLNKTL